MEQFNITMRKYLKEEGVPAQRAIEGVVREEKLAGKGKLKVKMVLTGEGTNLKQRRDRLGRCTRYLDCSPIVYASAQLTALHTERSGGSTVSGLICGEV